MTSAGQMADDSRAAIAPAVPGGGAMRAAPGRNAPKAAPRDGAATKTEGLEGAAAVAVREAHGAARPKARCMDMPIAGLYANDERLRPSFGRHLAEPA